MIFFRQQVVMIRNKNSDKFKICMFLDRGNFETRTCFFHLEYLKIILIKSVSQNFHEQEKYRF